MFTAFERKVAFRYLRARRREGFISVIAWFSLLGIALGVATLIIVMAVMNGFRAELLDRILGINAHVTLSNFSQPIKDYEAITEKILGTDGVVAATPTIEGQALVSANGYSTGALVRGIRSKDLGNKTLITSKLSGDIAQFNGNASVILGFRLARSLGVDIGDSIQLLSPSSNATVIGAIPRMKEYTVAGTFDVGMFEYDSSIVFMPLEAAQLFFQYPDSVNRIEIMVEKPDDAPSVTAALIQTLSGRYYLSDWMQANAHFFSSLKVERNVMFLILTLIILVAAFNIIAGMIMMVNDKTRAIAILRTVGASKGSILRIFITTGAFIGIAGTLLGIALGLGFVQNINTIKSWLEQASGTELFSAEIYFLSHLPAIVEMDEVISVVVMSLALSFLATLYPAWRAASISPAEGVRRE